MSSGAEGEDDRRLGGPAKLGRKKPAQPVAFGGGEAYHGGVNRQWRARLIGGLTAALVVTGAAAQPSGGDDVVVARVGTVAITRGEIERRMARIPAIQLSTFGTTPEEIRRTFVEKVVMREYLLSQGAQALADQPEIRLKQDEVLRAALISKMHRDVNPRAITSEEVSRYFEANRERFQTADRVRVYRILVATREEAAALIAEAKKGDEARWKELARDRSLDKASNERGGDLGFLSSDGHSSEVSVQANPALYVAARKLTSGEIGPEPVAEGERWAVIWNRGLQPAQRRSLEQEEGSIRALLARQKLEAMTKEITDRLRASQVHDVTYEGVQMVEINAVGEVGPRKRPDVVRHKAPGKPQPTSGAGGLR